MTARVSILLESRASLTCFRACFLPGRAKGLSAPQYYTATTTTTACYQLYTRFFTAINLKQSSCSIITMYGTYNAVSHDKRFVL